MKRSKRIETPVGHSYTPPVAGVKKRPCLGLNCTATVEGDAGTRLCPMCSGSRAAPVSKREEYEIRMPRL